MPDDGPAITVFLGLLSMQDREVETFTPRIIVSKGQQRVSIAHQCIRSKLATSEDR